MTSRIYLDNAATSWPKSPSVIEAVLEFITNCGATAGRGSYRSATVAESWLADARLQLARLIGAPDSDSIAFCSSGTHALNAALLGLIRQGDHVLTTEIEHNSVLRPLAHLARHKAIKVDYARSDARGIACLEHAAELIRPDTKWLVVGHASNVTGAIQDLRAWGRLAGNNGARLIVDASQTLGYVPINVNELGISVLASAGHKGLGGIAGTGFLYVAKDLQPCMLPLMTGGTGLNSESVEFTHAWPQIIEVGNHNLPGIISMAVAAREFNQSATSNLNAVQSTWKGLFDLMLVGLRSIPNIALVGYPQDSEPPSVTDRHTASSSESVEDARLTEGLLPDRVPLVSLQVEGWAPHDLASVLDSSFGIETRAGLHCAALVHKAIGSQPFGGTLRLSLGHSSTKHDVLTVLDALKTIVQT